MKKLIIGITTRNINSNSGVQVALNQTYLDAIAKIDAIPLLLTKDNLQMFSQIDGLIISGGDDVNPSYYHQLKHYKTSFDHRVDDLDFECIRLALEHKIPILGICRGIQVINVYFNGTLIQDLPSLKNSHLHKTDEYIVFNTHDVIIKPDCFLSQIFPLKYFCNTAHHQAIDKLGDNLEICALSKDNIIEAIKHQSLPIYGIQWHPERLLEDKYHLQLFYFFKEQCLKNK